MKNWEMPVMEELTISATAQGSKVITTIDNTWFDSEKGEIHADFDEHEAS